MAALNTVNNEQLQPAPCGELTLAHEATDNRDDARHELDGCVAFRNASGQRCNARLVNLSPTGAQIRCNAANAQILHPRGGRICPTNAPIVQTEIRLPFGDRASTVTICAQLVYLKTLNEAPPCLIGLKFMDLRPTAARLLEQFFAAESVR